MKNKVTENSCKKIFSLKEFFINVFLLVSGIILFALPQPNFLTVNGISFIAYFSLIPVFLLVRRLSWKSIWLYGFLYGFSCYSLYAYWLAAFHPMGITVISSMYGIMHWLLMRWSFIRQVTMEASSDLGTCIKWRKNWIKKSSENVHCTDLSYL